MFAPRPISREGVPLALQKAERYRVINDPSSAESICLDILQVDPDNETAVVTLLLALTDQFGESSRDRLRHARELLPRLRDPYRQAYYAGIIAERWAKAQLHRGGMASGEIAYHAFMDAMKWYEKAEAQRPPGNDEAILRWNTCARILAANSQLKPRSGEPVDLDLE
jgi:hypothetical protein